MLTLFASVQSQILNSACQGSSDPSSCTSSTTLPFVNITDTLFYIIGGVAVIMVVIGGLRYVLSAGNPAATKSARETIIYALVGLAIATMAFVIVSFVTGKFGG